LWEFRSIQHYRAISTWYFRSFNSYLQEEDRYAAALGGVVEDRMQVPVRNGSSVPHDRALKQEMG
jgi:hypothetical protein